MGRGKAAARSTEEVSGGMAQRSAGPQPLIVTGQNIRDGASSGRRGGARLFKGRVCKTATPVYSYSCS
jgi:hypothetical protein